MSPAPEFNRLGGGRRQRSRITKNVAGNRLPSVRQSVSLAGLEPDAVSEARRC